LLMMRPSTKKVLQRVSQGFRSKLQLSFVPNPWQLRGFNCPNKRL
jgi:hypothetical protein